MLGQEEIKFYNFSDVMQKIIDEYAKYISHCCPKCKTLNQNNDDIYAINLGHWGVPTYLCAIRDWKIISECLITSLYFTEDNLSIDKLHSIHFRNQYNVIITDEIRRDTSTMYYTTTYLDSGYWSKLFEKQIQQMKEYVEIERAKLIRRQIIERQVYEDAEVNPSVPGESESGESGESESGESEFGEPGNSEPGKSKNEGTTRVIEKNSYSLTTELLKLVIIIFILWLMYP